MLGGVGPPHRHFWVPGNSQKLSPKFEYSAFRPPFPPKIVRSNADCCQNVVARDKRIDAVVVDGDGERLKLCRCLQCRSGPVPTLRV
jgi:hypothetical protein